ncbi:DNRLRE domain-containing protein [Nonomuraea pusilla]|uniref:DNRLRE domain-containing protein n=1 Tax=Nonomuraea pusilla TaxID=46177 RepID=UPI0033229A23
MSSEGHVDRSSGYLWAGSYAASKSYKVYERAYLKFDATALQGKTITSATFKAKNSVASGCGTAESGILAQRVTADWSPATISWPNRPADTTQGAAVARDPQPCVDGNQPPTNTTWEWNVTSIVQAWVSGAPNYGFLLRETDETQSAPMFERGFLSSRTDQGSDALPTLTVTYSDVASSPTPAAPLAKEPDADPPTVVEVTPTVEAESMPSDSTISMRFSEPVASGSISVSDYPGLNRIPGQASMNADNTILTFTPSQPLNGNIPRSC